MKNHFPTKKIALMRYDENGRGSRVEISFPEINTPVEVPLDDAVFVVSVEPVPSLPSTTDQRNITVVARCIRGFAPAVVLDVFFDFSEWSPQNYVLFPGAVYAGNRFTSIGANGYEAARKELVYSKDMGIIQSNVPRLALNGPSRVQLLAGDCATPACCIHLADCNCGFIVLSMQKSGSSDISLSLAESDDRSQARLTFRAPGVREDTVFQGGFQPFRPTREKGRDLSNGEECTLTLSFKEFDAPSLQRIYDVFFDVRETFGPRNRHEELPFGAAFSIQEKKYNEQNWVEEYGYYSVGMRENVWQDWQTGWTGGMNAVLPLITDGNTTTTSRVLRTFDFLLTGIAPSGYFHGAFTKGEWLNVKNLSPGIPDHIFVRRSADALYFMLMEFEALCTRGLKPAIPDTWIHAAQGCADAFVRTWQREGQFGQHVDAKTGDVIAGGTAAAGIVPGALALCSRFFKNSTYLDVAVESARYFDTHFIQKGITNGGPGDIFSAIDSESAFGLLESYVTLYEVTNDSAWLTIAKNCAHQCATWVVSYDFAFPLQSTFARMNMHTTGTVIANVQNKHSAPGICTLSGCSLFRLFRYTNNKKYLDLGVSIAHAIPEYLSRNDRPIPENRSIPARAMPAGWMNERINMSDWEERGVPGGDIPRGEIFYGSCWSEVSCLLTYAQFPGVYVQPDTGVLAVADNINCTIIEKQEHSVTLRMHNPSQFDTAVKVFSEHSENSAQILSKTFLLSCMVIQLGAGQSVETKIEC